MGHDLTRIIVYDEKKTRCITKSWLFNVIVKRMFWSSVRINMC